LPAVRLVYITPNVCAPAVCPLTSQARDSRPITTPKHFHHARPGCGICSDACPTSVRLHALRRCHALPPAVLRAVRFQEASPNGQHHTSCLFTAPRTPPRHGGRQCRCSHGGCRQPWPRPAACCGLALAALGNDALILQMPLGSPPPGSKSDVSSGYTTVLKASADFIRTIYNTRWPR
jgi:hypothetical protein